MRYWHNALLPQAGLRLAQISEPVMRTANGTYYVRSEKAGDATLLALLRVYATFPYDNDYLKNKFAPAFSLPSASGISTGPTKNGVDVNGPEGEYLFTVTKVWVQTPPAWLSAVSCALLLLAFVSLLCTVGGMAEAVARRGHTALALALAAVLLACVRRFGVCCSSRSACSTGATCFSACPPRRVRNRALRQRAMGAHVRCAPA